MSAPTETDIRNQAMLATLKAQRDQALDALVLTQAELAVVNFRHRPRGEGADAEAGAATPPGSEALEVTME